MAVVGIIGTNRNQYGTLVSVLVCSECGRTVTLCPATDTEHWGTACLAEDCPSYDLDRDVDLFWDALSDHHLIRRTPVT